MVNKNYKVVVLNDRETYSELEDCRILTLSEEGYLQLLQGYKPSQIPRGEIIFEEEVKPINLPLSPGN